MSLVRSSLLFSLGTLCSRLLGLLRESVLAAVFGAGLLLDAFLIANRIPNMLRELLAEGALGSSFTKVFTQLNETDQNRARQLMVDALWLFSLLTLCSVVVGYWGAPWFVKALTLQRQVSGDDPLIAQAVHLTRILFPFIGLMSIGAVLGGGLHQQGRFFLSAAAPVMLNIGYIAGALLIGPALIHFAQPHWSDYGFDLGILGLALGVLLGGLLQTLVQLAGVWRPILWLGSARVRLIWNKDLKRVLILMGPMVIASGAGQINVVINTNFATGLEAGAVSWLSFAFRILQLPIGLFGVAIASVSLPLLVKSIEKYGAGHREVRAQLSQAVLVMLHLILPCFCFFVVNTDGIVRLLFHYGRFGEYDVTQTATALYAYSFGLVGYGLIKVLTATYYAIDRTRTAMQISLLGIGINFVCNWLLIDQFGHKGLAYTASIVLSLNAIFLAIGLKSSGFVLSISQIFLWAVRFGVFVVGAIGLQQFVAQLSFFGSGQLSALLSQLAINALIVITCAFVLSHYSGMLATLRRR